MKNLGNAYNRTRGCWLKSANATSVQKYPEVIECWIMNSFYVVADRRGCEAQSEAPLEPEVPTVGLARHHPARPLQQRPQWSPGGHLSNAEPQDPRPQPEQARQPSDADAEESFRPEKGRRRFREVSRWNFYSGLDLIRYQWPCG